MGAVQGRRVERRPSPGARRKSRRGRYGPPHLHRVTCGYSRVGMGCGVRTTAKAGGQDARGPRAGHGHGRNPGGGREGH